ncbi:MAG: glycosyltransferase family 2 protein [Acidimicrobiia bacterium]
MKVILTSVEGADIKAALGAVGRQVYEPAPTVVVVAPSDDGLPEGTVTAPTLETAIDDTGPAFEYLWLLHADARPRPDALGALVSELERNQAAVGGSKLLRAGTPDELESMGGSTDVFGEPYTGIDEGEIDLQQYDVVREVAFVQSASMLVRRDLAQGLHGLDPTLPPVAAGLDFSQRARLAGAAVITVPSSEVYHQGRCREHLRNWREQAGRLRAMMIAYRPLTLIWVVPVDLLVSAVDSVANLLLLRWRPMARHFLSWGWNLLRLPSTIAQRLRFRSVRAAGDEELFRFQASGSIRLREIGEELSGRLLSLFDEEGAIATRTQKALGSPGMWGGLIAMLIILIGARSLFFSGVPNAGLSFPFEPPSVAFERWLGGWNDSGLGSPDPVHPSVAVAALVSFVWFGAEGAARFLATIGAGVVAVFGMGVLAGRLGLSGPGRFLAGLALVAGPGTAELTGVGAWHALAGAAVLPWAVLIAFPHPNLPAPGGLSSYGKALIWGTILAALGPLLIVVPLLFVVLWRAWSGHKGSVPVALAVLAGAVVAVPFVTADRGWLLDPSGRLGLMVEELWPALVALAALPLVFVGNDRAQRVGIVGGLLALAALVGARLGPGGQGIEEALLITSSFGVALVVAGGLNSISLRPQRLAANFAATALLFLSVLAMGNGRLGLPPGDLNQSIEFAAAGVEGKPPARVLIASTEPALIPGADRAGPGFWYRLVDGTGMTHDEVWLPPGREADASLGNALSEIASGGELRAGARLVPYAVEWVVLVGPESPLDRVLSTQLDMVPIPLEEQTRVFQNSNRAPIAATDEGAWARSGTGFAGEPGEGRVRLGVTYDDHWRPDPRPASWAVEVSASEGRAEFEPDAIAVAIALASALVAAAGLAMVVVERVRR